MSAIGSAHFDLPRPGPDGSGHRYSTPQRGEHRESTAAAHGSVQDLAGGPVGPQPCRPDGQGRRRHEQEDRRLFPPQAEPPARGRSDGRRRHRVEDPGREDRHAAHVARRPDAGPGDHPVAGRQVRRLRRGRGHHRRSVQGHRLQDQDGRQAEPRTEGRQGHHRRVLRLPVPVLRPRPRDDVQPGDEGVRRQGAAGVQATTRCPSTSGPSPPPSPASAPTSRIRSRSGSCTTTSSPISSRSRRRT